jgi:hypothetical protein
VLYDLLTAGRSLPRPGRGGGHGCVWQLPDRRNLATTRGHRRRHHVLAYFDRHANGPIEAINERPKALRCTALGFRDLTHYRVLSRSVARRCIYPWPECRLTVRQLATLLGRPKVGSIGCRREAGRDPVTPTKVVYELGRELRSGVPQPDTEQDRPLFDLAAPDPSMMAVARLSARQAREIR